jgi:glycosyltransferase involved in cell wall biosynthesis
VKVVALTRTSARGPSSRYRIEQYRPRLAAGDIHVETRPLFGEAWFALLEWPSALLRVPGKALYTAARLPVRAAQALAAGRSGADVVHIEQQLFPYLPWALESLLWPRRQPVVLEFDDAIYLTFAHRRKLERACARADLVITGNRFLADFAVRHARGPDRVRVIPTTVDPDRYRCEPRPPDGTLRVGWIGLRYNFPYLAMLARPLARMVADGLAVELRVISSAAPDLGPEARAVPVVHRPWSEATEAAELAACDVGVMPLPATEWAQGKCGLKLLQFMASSRPVVASPVGFNTELVADGRNGLLAADEAGWEAALRRLHEDPALARRLGEAGRHTVEQHYSLSAGVRQVAEAYRQLTDIGRPQGRDQGRHPR